MRFAGTDITDVVAALARRGFDYVGEGRDKGWLQFKGQLTANGAEHACDMEVHRDLDTLPLFWLTDMPPGKPELLPHLSHRGYLCYIAHGSAIVDPFDPIGQSLQAIVEAERVLDAVLKGEMKEDLADEFFQHWGGKMCVLDIQEELPTNVEAIDLVGKKDERWVIISDDKARTEAKLKCFDMKLAETKVVPMRVFTGARPIPYQADWPPKTVAELLNWQKTLDPDCARGLEVRLLKLARAGASAVAAVIETPQMQYAFRVDLHLPPHKPGKPLPIKAALLRHQIVRLNVERIDDRYMAQRNQPGGKTLAGLKIALVGCGTIGGYLAEMLVKAGAGTGRGAQLCLSDYEKLQAHNIGRHRLGFSSLFEFKSKALETELRRAAPGAKIDGFINDAKVENMDGIDLIIDATGEQSLTDWLAWRYNGKVPLLSVWVEGPGQAVRALLKHKPANACPRCISRPPRSDEFQVFDTPIDHVLQGHGCEGLYVPFPASASIQAAALAMEMTQAWANREEFSTFRTRALDMKRTQRTFDCTPARNEDCPACST